MCEGGDLTQGDVLVLSSPHELYITRNANDELVRVQLAPRLGQRPDRPADRGHALALLHHGCGDAAGLMVVNGQMDRQKNPPALLPFDVLTVQLPR